VWIGDRCNTLSDDDIDVDPGHPWTWRGGEDNGDSPCVLRPVAQANTENVYQTQVPGRYRVEIVQQERRDDEVVVTLARAGNEFRAGATSVIARTSFTLPK
jgi:hypothetical protein